MLGLLAMFSLANQSAPMSLSAAPERPPTEYEVKAAYIFYFAKFVNWSEEAFPHKKAPLTIGIFDDREFDSLVATIVKDKTVQDHPISIKRLKADADLQGCHIIYISSSALKRTKTLIDSIRDLPALTITEADSHYKSKGIINLNVEGGKVQFEVDVAGAERAHLQISSKLLRLGRNAEMNQARD
jgi:hypothetical protein